jgi:hypothetical protein
MPYIIVSDGCFIVRSRFPSVFHRPPPLTIPHRTPSMLGGGRSEMPHECGDRLKAIGSAASAHAAAVSGGESCGRNDIAGIARYKRAQEDTHDACVTRSPDERRRKLLTPAVQELRMRARRCEARGSRARKSRKPIPRDVAL